MSQPAKRAATAEPPTRSVNHEISPSGVSSIVLTFEGEIQTKKCDSLWECQEIEGLKNG